MLCALCVFPLRADKCERLSLLYPLFRTPGFGQAAEAFGSKSLMDMELNSGFYTLELSATKFGNSGCWFVE
jgi:hypothetical protein